MTAGDSVITCVCVIVQVASRFLRRVGLLLHSVPKIKHDVSGEEMVYPWYGDDSSSGRIVRLGNSSRAKRASAAAVSGYVEISLQADVIASIGF